MRLPAVAGVGSATRADRVPPPITFYVTIPAGGLRPSIPPVPVLLSAASFARFRHGKFGLLRRPQIPEHLPDVAADGGGFVAARQHGDYEYVAIQYVEWLLSFNASWAAMTDFPVEPELAFDESAIRERQQRTTELGAFLWDQYPDTPWAWVPTVQGWQIDDFVYHAEELAPLIYDLRHEYNPWSWDREDPEADALAARARLTRSESASAHSVGGQVHASSASSPKQLRTSCLGSRFTSGAETQHAQERRSASSGRR